MKDKIKSEVIINGQSYKFYNRIGDSKELLASFNSLASRTFGGLTFDCVGGYYEPHVLVREGQVCANISVNQIPFVFDGREIFCVQRAPVFLEAAP